MSIEGVCAGADLGVQMSSLRKSVEVLTCTLSILVNGSVVDS
jgi:hypothetical protein